MFYQPDHPKAYNDGYVPEHILVAEKILGRGLTKEEVVHHIDMNKLNNSEDNLIVFKNAAEHTRFHKNNCLQDTLVKLDDGTYCCNSMMNPNTKLLSKCPLCGKQKDFDAKMCIDCYLDYRSKNIPEKDQLLHIIEKFNGNFLKIGKWYNVSDNAIRKWCKKYGIEYHARYYRDLYQKVAHGLSPRDGSIPKSGK